MKKSLIVALVIIVGIGLLHALKNNNGTEVAENEKILSLNESKCVDLGWKRVVKKIDDIDHELFWKGPTDAWKGSVIVLHGGGSDYTQWCYQSNRVSKPQVDFSNVAISHGFGVFLIDSTTDVVTDAKGLPCGKRFDATIVDNRSQNVDLSFIEYVIKNIIPSSRPQNSNTGIFIVGHSSGGYMAIRAGTHFDGLVTAFAPVAAGDPYGTYFDCNTALSPRQSAKGAGFDRETNKEIIRVNSCVSESYPHERTWETMNPVEKPSFKTFHNEDDGIADLSCSTKVVHMLREHGYQDEGSFIVPSQGERGVLAHLWMGVYNLPIIQFFEKHAE